MPPTLPSEEEYANAINTIADYTVAISLADTGDGDEEDFELILEDYQMAEAQFISDAYSERTGSLSFD